MLQKRLRNSILFFSGLAILLWVNNASAQDNKGSGQRFLIEPRVTIVTAGGEPSNDMTMYGLYGRYRLKGQWHFALSIDQAKYDFEEPYRILGISNASTKAVDASASETIISVGVEREFTLKENLTPYVAGGIGVGFISVDDIFGTTQGGGQYNITTDAGTEFIPYLNCGIRWMFRRNYSFDLAAKLEHHVADWTVRDRVSGRTGTIDDYTAYGGNIGFAIYF